MENFVVCKKSKRSLIRDMSNMSNNSNKHNSNNNSLNLNRNKDNSKMRFLSDFK